MLLYRKQGSNNVCESVPIVRSLSQVTMNTGTLNATKKCLLSNLQFEALFMQILYIKFCC